MTQKYYIIGLFNIDINSSDISNNSALFFNMLRSSGIFSFADRPTRVTGSSSTVTDYILTNDTSNIIHLYIFYLKLMIIFLWDV